MNKSYCMAPEVAKIGKELIRKHHTHLISHGARVEFLFALKTPKKAGREVWGTARKISSLPAFLADMEAEGEGDDFFVIVIAQPIWQYLPQKQREALVDHELMHCWAEEDEETGDSKFSILAHDFEGFNAEIRRHGMWRQDAQQLFDAMKEAEQVAQGQIPFDGTEVGAIKNVVAQHDVQQAANAQQPKKTGKREVIIGAAPSTQH